MARMAANDPNHAASIQQQAGTKLTKKDRKYDSSKPDPNKVAKIRADMYRISPFYSAVIIVPIGLLMSGGRMESLYVTILRLPFQTFATKNPGFDYHTVMAVGTGLMDAVVRYVALYIYPGGATIGRAFSLAMGWGVLEAFAGFFSMFATVALADRHDPQSLDAKRRMKEINMPDPMSINPPFSFMEHLSEALFTLGNCLLMINGGDPVGAGLAGLVHASCLYIARVSFRGTKMASGFLLAASICVLAASLVLSEFYVTL
ncbi:hypothetical protein HDU67_007213 [Dinochytrium kinnereticum]|nr:hypothetical protein HDU67_007213 [Dinochytrium kinnereticum]